MSMSTPVWMSHVNRVIKGLPETFPNPHTIVPVPIPKTDDWCGTHNVIMLTEINEWKSFIEPVYSVCV